MMMMIGIGVCGGDVTWRIACRMSVPRGRRLNDEEAHSECELNREKNETHRVRIVYNKTCTLLDEHGICVCVCVYVNSLVGVCRCAINLIPLRSLQMRSTTNAELSIVLAMVASIYQCFSVFLLFVFCVIKLVECCLQVNRAYTFQCFAYSSPRQSVRVRECIARVCFFI